MPPETIYYKPPYQIMSQTEFLQRSRLGISYTGNVEGIGYVETTVLDTGTVFQNGIPVDSMSIVSIRYFYPPSGVNTGNASNTESHNNGNPWVDIISFFSTGTGIGLELYTAQQGLSGMRSVANAGRFMSTYKNVAVTWRNGFMGSQYISAAYVAAEKGKFASKLAHLNKLSKFSKGLGWVGVFTGGASAILSEKTSDRVLGGADAIMSLIGMYCGAYGVAISGIYSFGRLAGPSYMKFSVDYHIERADRINRGDYSTVWWAPGRSVR